jgi:hypothetical protein
MQQIISKEELNSLINIQGKASGIPLKTDFDYIFKKQGEKAVKRLEEEMASLGFSIKHKQIRSTDSYPLGLLAISLLLIKKLFNYSNEDIYEMGRVEGKSSSLIIRLFMKYFGSLKMIAREAEKMWRKHYSVGELKVKKLDEEKRQAVLEVRDFKLHPLHCLELGGYLASVIQMSVGRHTKCQETKCIHKGDKCHEFKMTW